MTDVGDHLMKKSAKSKMVTLEASVELTRNDPVRNRVRCAWCKFRELIPLLAMRGFPLKFKGKVVTKMLATWSRLFGIYYI